MVPTHSALGYDSCVIHDIENRLAQDGVLLHTDLGVNALKCVGNPLRDIDRTVDIGRKQLQWIDQNAFTARLELNRFGVFHKLSRGRLDCKALSIVKHNGWNLLLRELGQDAAYRIRFAESTFAKNQHVRISGAT
jgi:hypothetical protein